MQRLIQSTEACCSHLVAMNQATFKILSVVAEEKEKKKNFPWGFPNNATDLFYMLKYRNPFFFPTEVDFHKNGPRNESTLISPVPLALSLFVWQHQCHFHMNSSSRPKHDPEGWASALCH